MARRKLTVVEQAIKDASAELGLPKDHWDVERLATLQVMLKAARHKWENGQSSSAASDMVTLMEEITKLRAAAGLTSGPREMEITFVEGVTGVYKCTECGHENRLEEGKYTPASPPQLAKTEPQQEDQSRRKRKASFAQVHIEAETVFQPTAHQPIRRPI